MGVAFRVPQRVVFSGDLTDSEWLAELETIGTERGYFVRLGDAHAAVFSNGPDDILFVSFESMEAIRSFNANGLPLGFGTPDMHGWAHLSLIARGETWFRARHVWNYIDRLVDEGFFEEFDRVVFYGAGMCGYAAAAYSVAAPGATVIAVSPQATLDPAIAGWDDRFTRMRRTDFTRRYGYAPAMIEAARRAYILYDPSQELDAMHATLFRRPNVELITYRRGAAGAIDADLRALGVLDTMIEQAAVDRLSRMSVFRALRARRFHLPYLRFMLSRIPVEERPWLTAIFCKAVLKTHRSPRFRHFFDQAADALRMQGRAVPGEADEGGAPPPRDPAA